MINNLSQIKEDLIFILPEIVLSLSIIFIILLDLILKRWYAGLNKALLLIALLTAGFVIINSGFTSLKNPVYIFSHFIVISSSVYRLKLLLILLSALVIPFIPNLDKQKASIFISLFIAILLGTFFMISAGSLLTIYLGIEVVSLCSYMLIAFNTDTKSFEASIKYLLFGAVASGVMLFGFSWMYGVTGSIYLTPEFFTSLGNGPSLFVITSIVFVLIGFLFKIGAFPLHIWIPDTYEGADSSVAAFLSIVPKTAGLLLIFNFLSGLNNTGFISIIRELLFISAIITMLLGTFAAIRQSIFQRLLAYSSIVHSGFLLAIVCAPSTNAMSSVLFYMVAYAFANCCVFFINSRMISQYGYGLIEQYSQPFSNKAIYGIAVLIAVVSLVGIPPTLGFTAKLLLFSSLWESYVSTSNSLVLASFSVGLLTAIVGLFYYLKVPYQIFIKSGNHSMKLSISYAEAAILLIYTIPLIVIFFQPEWLLKLIADI